MSEVEMGAQAQDTCDRRRKQIGGIKADERVAKDRRFLVRTMGST